MAVDLKSTFDKKGYFLIENFFDKKILSSLIKDIETSDDVDKYFDQANKLRRIERLYNKTDLLNKVNNDILNILEKIFGTKYTIFKDKYNAKPPGGEGFFAHFDGVFKFIDENNNEKNGWYEYSNNFINVLVALDPCNEKNGTIEIADRYNGNFNELYEITQKNGTPNIINNIEKKLNFEKIILNAGDIVIFSNTCPHRSKKNNSEINRKTLYYTYTQLKDGSKYLDYFRDKSKSKNNTSKSLSGEI
jgi:ectoine hydroxylase-related dioxygenase (phytanoyl-CoA dioxygenase family)